MAVVTRGGVAGVERVSRRLLVIGAHSADFVWRAGGAVAVTTPAGGEARVIALSYGERGESGELWKEPGQTIERVKEIRHEEAERAAAALGADFRCLDLGDYPLEIDARALDADRRRDPRVRPGRARHAHGPRPVQPGPRGRGRRGRPRPSLAAGAGVPSAFATVSRRRSSSSSRTSRSSATSSRPPSSTSPPCSSRSSRRWPR